MAEEKPNVIIVNSNSEGIGSPLRRNKSLPSSIFSSFDSPKTTAPTRKTEELQRGTKFSPDRNKFFSPTKRSFFSTSQEQLSGDNVVHLTVVDTMVSPDKELASTTLEKTPSIKVKSAKYGTDLEIKLSNPNQFRAFSRRAFSYQRRQSFENICCIALCPILMIVLSFVLRTVIANLSDGGGNKFQVLYCSDKDSSNQQNWPIYNINGVQIQKNSDKSIYYVNYLSRLALVDLTGRDPIAQVVAATAAGSLPCVQWFAEGYPTDRFDVYSKPNRFENSYANKDSLYTYEILSGWLDVLLPTKGGTDLTSDIARQAISLLRTFISYQTRPWSIVASNPNIATNVIGNAPKQPPLNDSSQIPGANATIYFKPASEADGLLGTIEPRFYVLLQANPPGLTGYQQVPFFEKNYTSEDELSEVYYQKITEAIQILADVPPVNQKLYDVSPDIAVAQSLFQMKDAVSGVPFTGIYFDSINHDNKTYGYTIQSGNNDAISNVQGFPSAGFRSILTQSQLSNSILRFSNPSLGSTTITQGTRAFPFLQDAQLQIPFGSIIGRILYPLGISFLLPIFTLALVREKENKILVMLRMNGMGDVTGYYISTYVTFYINYCISSSLFLITGYIFNLDLFRKTAIGILILVLLLWGHVQICLAFVFNAIFRSSSIATVSVFILTVCGVVTSFILSQIFISVSSFPVVLYMWPPFLFYRVLDLLNRHATSTLLRPYTFKMLTDGNVIQVALIILAVEVVVLLLLAIYLTQILPSEYGLQRPWHFPVTDFLAWINGKKELYGPEPVVKLEKHVEDEDKEDDDVRNERKRIVEGNYPADAPLIMQGMRKEYMASNGKSKLAVKEATFCVENNVVLGLLGPNGAGKTTLISILTGVYPATSGTAKLAGFDIKNQSELALRSIGVCPQFDILWSDLTVEEHLYFYARLKGVAIDFEDDAVNAALELVKMTLLRERLVKGLSGGEKRRVSIAISLVSNPKVVFLDEPTTGLDPEVRRTVWDTIARARGNRAILMTTHSMEEAEVCCQTIGIMAKGRMRCFGSPTRLKHQYGCGYKLSLISIDFPKTDELLQQILPDGYRLMHSFHSSRRYAFVPTADQLAHIFDQLVSRSKEHGIQTWGISQTTLDEIFTTLISNEDASG